MKRSVFVSLILALVLSLAACSSQDTSGTKKDTKKEKSAEVKKEEKVLSKEEFTKMFSDPKKYKGSKVDFYAKIFVDPEKDNKGTYLQAYADNNQDRNTVIAIKDPNLNVKTDDVVHVTGEVKDAFEGENALGGKVTAPTIIADKVEIADYATAFAPALKTIDVNKEINQYGYVMKINKIEIAENETRLYMTVTNNTKDKISFYDFNTKLLVNNQQLELSDNFEANYKQVQSEILPGVTTDGILAFPKIPQSGQLKVHAEGGSDNYDIDIKPFEFDVQY